MERKTDTEVSQNAVIPSQQGEGSEFRPFYAGVCHGCHTELGAEDRETFDRVVNAHLKAHGAVQEMPS